MKFKIDENLPIEAAAVLKRAGHDALTAVQQALGGKDDNAVASACANEERILVTADMDFSDIRTYPPGGCAGIIVLRLRRQDKKNVISTIERLTGILASESPERQLWVVSETRVRMRP